MGVTHNTDAMHTSKLTLYLLSAEGSDSALPPQSDTVRGGICHRGDRHSPLLKRMSRPSVHSHMGTLVFLETGKRVYTGRTTNANRRLSQHASAGGGSVDPRRHVFPAPRHTCPYIEIEYGR